MKSGLVEKKKLLQELEDKIKFYYQNRNEKYEYREYDLFYPVLDTEERKDLKKIFSKYSSITMKDMIHSDYLTENFCNWYFDEDDFEWYYTCGRGENKKFFNCIPPVLLNLKYENLTKISINESQITKIEYIPQNVKNLDLSDNKIQKIENIPQNLNSLHLSGNQIQKIENIPESVEYLHLNSNKIKKIENLPLNLCIFHIKENPIIKLESLPDKIIDLYICSENLLEYGDLSNLKKPFTLKHNPKNNLFEVPLTNINLIMNYYPKGYQEIQYINTINLQNYYFKKWRSIVQIQKDIKDYNYLLSSSDDEISKLSNLLFYIIIKFYNQNYVKTVSDRNIYYNYLWNKERNVVLEMSLENLKKEYNEKRSKCIDILKKNLRILTNEKIKPFHYKKIKILLNPKQHPFIKKKREFNVNKDFNTEDIRSVFPPNTTERELLDYYLDKNQSNENYFTFVKNSQNYTLRYPFYKNNDRLTPFLDLSCHYFESLNNQEIIDSEYEEYLDKKKSENTVYSDW